MNETWIHRSLFLCVALAAATGCTSVNVRLNDAAVPLEERQQNHTLATTFAAAPPIFRSTSTAPSVEPPENPQAPASPGEHPPRTWRGEDGWFVGLALSGGGSRSANFSAACMFEMQRLGILPHVDYISTVSGGSLAGAYYCLNDDERWNPGSVQEKLTHPFASDVIVQMFVPWTAVVLALSDWDRSDLLADSFKRTLFTGSDGRGQTFADLRRDRPHLLINATDLQSGRPFVFCDASFDQINSDLSKYPIAYAVAASAAVPVVMNHVTLRDFSTIYKQYRHLIDGGINDNLGITTLVETYEAHSADAEKRGAPDPYPRGAVFFVIDARTRFDARLDDKGDIGLVESLATGATVTSNALLNRVSSATLAEIIVKHSPDDVTAGMLRQQIAALERDGLLTLRDRRGHRVTVVHLALSRIEELSDLPSRGFFQRLNDIATYFNITRAESAALYKAATLLVREKYEDRMQQIADELSTGENPAR